MPEREHLPFLAGNFPRNQESQNYRKGNGFPRGESGASVLLHGHRQGCLLEPKVTGGYCEQVSNGVSPNPVSLAVRLVVAQVPKLLSEHHQMPAT